MSSEKFAVLGGFHQTGLGKTSGKPYELFFIICGDPAESFKTATTDRQAFGVATIEFQCEPEAWEAVQRAYQAGSRRGPVVEMVLSTKRDREGKTRIIGLETVAAVAAA